MAPPPDPVAAAARDAELSAWMARFGPGLRRYFAKRAGLIEADDLVQEVFLRLQARGEGQAAVDDVERYIFRTAANVLVSRRRHDAARGQGLHEPLTPAAEPVEDVSPERALIGRQDVARAIIAIRRLPPRTREAFIFHRFEEMTYPVIARRMGISISAVRQLVSRAIEHVAQDMRRRT